MPRNPPLLSIYPARACEVQKDTVWSSFPMIHLIVFRTRSMGRLASYVAYLC